MIVAKRQETQTEKHKAELWSSETILQLEEIQEAICTKRSGRKQEMHKWLSDLWTVREGRRSGTDTHFSVAVIMLSIEKSTEVLKKAIYSIEETQSILDLHKTHALWWRKEKENVQNTQRNWCCFTRNIPISFTIQLCLLCKIQIILSCNSFHFRPFCLYYQFL